MSWTQARPPTKEILSYFTPDHLKFFGGHLGMKTIPPSYLNASVELFFQEADRAGVDRMLCVHRVVPAAGGSPRSDVSNDHIAEVVHAHPDRLSGVAGIDVGGDFGDPLEETRRAIDELACAASTSLQRAARSPRTGTTGAFIRCTSCAMTARCRWC